MNDLRELQGIGTRTFLSAFLALQLPLAFAQFSAKTAESFTCLTAI
jgi:hypothetical protein